MTNDPIPTNEPVPTDPNQTLKRGAVTDIALTVTAAGGTVQMIKTGIEAGAQLYDLLHPPKPEPSPIVLPPFNPDE